MRFRKGDIVMCKHSVHAVMWFPELVGCLATVTGVSYGPTHTGKEDQIELEIHIEPQRLPYPRVWSAELWVRIQQTGTH